MAELHIVLVEPQIPQNTGNIARTCAATGAALHIVRPMGFTVTDAKLKRAGLDYWRYLDITYYDGVEDFLEKARGPCFLFTTKAPRSYCDAAYPDNAYLLFGREDAGLPGELLARHPESCVRLPMRRGIRSLNLSNTVAVAAFEVLRQWGFPSLEAHGRLTQYNREDSGGL